MSKRTCTCETCKLCLKRARRTELRRLRGIPAKRQGQDKARKYLNDRARTKLNPTPLSILMLAKARQRAKQFNVPCTVVRADIEHALAAAAGRCAVLGILLVRGTRQAHANSPSLDRIEPQFGYVPGNIRVISHRANWLKLDATHEELQLVADDLKRLSCAS